MLSIPRLALADARILIEGAAREADALCVPMCIAVCDESGNLIAFERMDGAKVLSVTLAPNKAMTAAISRKPTAAYNEACQPGQLTFGIHTTLEGRFTVVGGGIPVTLGDQVLGGIGLSGGAPEQDIACAEAGLVRFHDHHGHGI